MTATQLLRQKHSAERCKALATEQRRREAARREEVQAGIQALDLSNQERASERAAAVDYTNTRREEAGQRQRSRDREFREQCAQAVAEFQEQRAADGPVAMAAREAGMAKLKEGLERRDARRRAADEKARGERAAAVADWRAKEDSATKGVSSDEARQAKLADLRAKTRAEAAKRRQAFLEKAYAEEKKHFAAQAEEYARTSRAAAAREESKSIPRGNGEAADGAVRTLPTFIGAAEATRLAKAAVKELPERIKRADERRRDSERQFKAGLGERIAAAEQMRMASEAAQAACHEAVAQRREEVRAAVVERARAEREQRAERIAAWSRHSEADAAARATEAAKKREEVDNRLREQDERRRGRDAEAQENRLARAAA